MSDTSVISKESSHENQSRRNHCYTRPSLCKRYWFHIAIIVLLLIIFTTSGTFSYLLYEEYQRNQRRQQMQEDFKKKHGLAEKVLSLISKGGPFTTWLNAHSQTAQVFHQLMNEMVEAIFGE